MPTIIEWFQGIGNIRVATIANKIKTNYIVDGNGLANSAASVSYRLEMTVVVFISEYFC